MNKTMLLLVAAAMAFAMVMPAPTTAQETQQGVGRNMPVFEYFDLDGDGTITETEFLKARSERIAKRAQEGRQLKNVADAPSFDDIDTDDDGGVDADEFAAHQAECNAKRSKR